MKLFKKIEEQFLDEESSDVKIICDGKTFEVPKTKPTGAEIELQIWDLWGTGIDCG